MRVLKEGMSNTEPADNNSYVPRVFLSYARRQPDEGWAERIVNVIVERLKLQIWFDKRGIRVGHPFAEEIDDAIRSSDAVAFLGSSWSLTSSYCRAECELCLNLSKPFVPLFIEPVDWTGFPPQFQRLHFEQLFRARDDDELTAMIGDAFRDAAIDLDVSYIPPRKQYFDQWAPGVHPPYRYLREASETVLRAFVEDCQTKLRLRPQQGYHNLNLALLFLKMGDSRHAQSYVDFALQELPANTDAYYFAALIAASHEPLCMTPRRRIERIEQNLDNAIALAGSETNSVSAATNFLPYLLKGILAHEYYSRNGFSLRDGTCDQLIAQAHRHSCDPQEVWRLRDSLKRLSETSLRIVKAKV